MSLKDDTRQVAVIVCGGIAAYKACEVVRGLQKADCDVRVAMTPDALNFVGKTTFEALTGHEVITSLYGNPGDPIPHISLAEFARLMVVVPATGNVMAKVRAGIADDAATSALLAARCPILFAPAMNVHMWQSAATQDNLQTLRGRGIHFVMPESGRLACGEIGEGKLASVKEIVNAALSELAKPSRPQDLSGMHFLINAGPTHEPIDPVRYIANASTGKMGYAIATAALSRGASVTLVSGPCALPAPEGATIIQVTTADEMSAACLKAFDDADAAICAAAVADYTPTTSSSHKLKKGVEELSVIRLKRTPDILAALAAKRGSRVVCGFAAETDDLISNASKKLNTKGCDLIVANDVSRKDSTFGADTSRIALINATGVEQYETMPLSKVANIIIDHVGELVAGRRQEQR